MWQMTATMANTCTDLHRRYAGGHCYDPFRILGPKLAKLHSHQVLAYMAERSVPKKQKRLNSTDSHSSYKIVSSLAISWQDIHICSAV